MSDKYLVQPGTMLYDFGMNRIGWVVRKTVYVRFVDSTGREYAHADDYKDWDVEWSNGKKEYLSESSLQIFILDFLRLQNEQ